MMPVTCGYGPDWPNEERYHSITQPHCVHSECCLTPPESSFATTFAIDTLKEKRKKRKEQEAGWRGHKLAYKMVGWAIHGQNFLHT